MKKYLRYFKIPLVLLLICFSYIIGYVYAGLQYAAPHFHANFAVFLNGERIDFSLDTYSQDLAGCKIGEKMYAVDRVHLHENNPDTIHVHHDGVTWGDFFANNNMLFNNRTFILDDGSIYSNNEKDTLRFILNGEEVQNPFNNLINSEDQLLISYWEESADELVLWKFWEVSKNAGEYNMKYDPGSCSGTHENSKIALIRDLLHSFMWH